MSTGKYKLNGHIPVECNNVLEWAQWHENADRKVAKTVVSNEVTVSTVFLGLDYRFGDGPPLLFETMVFGGPHDQEMERYSTWDEAEKGHALWVEKVR